MQKKRKLKKYVKWSLFSIVMIIGLSITVNTFTKTESQIDNFTYVNDYIIDNYHPVMDQVEKIIRPYNAQNISVYRYFYEKEATQQDQEKSIVLTDGTYIQNTGIDYSSENEFDVISSVSGTVSNITDDPVLGKSIEIKANNNIVMLYQSVSNIVVKKGDTVKQGDVIAKSGTCSLNGEVKNGLHFEIFVNGKTINPENNYDKDLKEIVK